MGSDAIHLRTLVPRRLLYNDISTDQVNPLKHSDFNI
jgi:hypothetical protein